MTGVVDVAVVPLVGLVLDVRSINGDTPANFFRSLVAGASSARCECHAQHISAHGDAIGKKKMQLRTLSMDW
jgi:hypothetical protein